jgi:hypothetical protein
MADLPGRPAFQPDGRVGADDEDGWGSPVPAEYGSLRAVRPAGTPVSDSADAKAPDPRAARSSLLRRLQDDAVAGAGAAAAVARRARRPRQGGPSRAILPAWGGEPAPAATPGGASDRAEIAPDTDYRLDDTATVPAVDPLAERPVPDVAVAGPRRRRAHRPARIRTRATVRHVDMLTVVRVAVVFWLVVLVALVVASLLLWTAADAFGSLPSIEKSVRTLFSLKSFSIHPGAVAGYTALVGIVIAVAGTLATIVLAVIYNLIADVVGGVRVELESFNRDQ